VINCTVIHTKYKINFINNQQVQTINTVFKFRKYLIVIYQIQQKFKDRFFDRLPPVWCTAVTEVATLISKCTLTDQFTHQTLP